MLYLSNGLFRVEKVRVLLFAKYGSFCTLEQIFANHVLVLFFKQNYPCHIQESYKDVVPQSPYIWCLFDGLGLPTQFLCQLTCQSADIMSSLCGVGVRVRVNNFFSKTTRPRDMLFFFKRYLIYRG